jgi:hypothetical protein
MLLLLSPPPWLSRCLSPHTLHPTLIVRGQSADTTRPSFRCRRDRKHWPHLQQTVHASYVYSGHSHRSPQILPNATSPPRRRRSARRGTRCASPVPSRRGAGYSRPSGPGRQVRGGAARVVPVVQLRLLREAGQLLRRAGVVNVVAVAGLHRHGRCCKHTARVDGKIIKK